MTVHDDSHDPTIDHAECFLCAAALRVSLNRLADMDLGPADAERLLKTIRLTALGAIEDGQYVPYDEARPL